MLLAQTLCYVINSSIIITYFSKCTFVGPSAGSVSTSVSSCQMSFVHQTLHDLQSGRLELAAMATSSKLGPRFPPARPLSFTGPAPDQGRTPQLVSLLPTVTPVSSCKQPVGGQVTVRLAVPQTKTVTAPGQTVKIGENKFIVVPASNGSRPDQTQTISTTDAHISTVPPASSGVVSAASQSLVIGKENRSLSSSSQSTYPQSKPFITSQPSCSTGRGVLSSSQGKSSATGAGHSSSSKKEKGKKQRHLSLSQRSSPTTPPVPELVTVKREPEDRGYFGVRIKRAKYCKYMYNKDPFFFFRRYKILM